MVFLPQLPRFICRDLRRLSESQLPAEERYDARHNPDQVNNLASDPRHAAVKESRWNELRAYLRKTGDPRVDGRDPWQAYPYRQTVGFGATFNRTLGAAERETAAGRGAHQPR